MAESGRCLNLCIVGDVGIGISSFIRTYLNATGARRLDATIENAVVPIILDQGDEAPWQARFIDNFGNPEFSKLRQASLCVAHVVFLCFRMDAQDTFTRLKDIWLPAYWHSGSAAPVFLVGLRSDLCNQGNKVSCISREKAIAFAECVGALSFLETSSFSSDSVKQAVDQALAAAHLFHSLQWQLAPQPPPADPAPMEVQRPLVDEAREMTETDVKAESTWLMHEQVNLSVRSRELDAEMLKKGLSELGLTPTRQHAFLRLDLVGLGLTSVEAVRPYGHLQYLDVSRNQLRTLQPLGALRLLLHLNASHNLLIRTQNFAAPDALETMDLSYNLITSLDDWGVHKYLRELKLRGNFIDTIGPGLRRSAELRLLDVSENYIPRIENLNDLGVRTLLLEQNRLTSLEGVGTLTQLHVLNVRHNNITSISALKANDVPRLRKLVISDNRISLIKEIEELRDFYFLVELVVQPNPVGQLPHFRAQVAHRLQNLRSLDGQMVSAENKVKADIIYGADINARKEVFEQLLPRETFVDRRLVTEEGIQASELQQFGKWGDAGPFGLPPDVTKENGGVGVRTSLQQAQFQQCMAKAWCGGVPIAGVLDLVDFAAPFVAFSVTDADLPAILEAVAEGGVEELRLGAATLSEAGVAEVLAFMAELSRPLHVDLAGCVSVVALGEHLSSLFPYEQGCSLEVAGCGLPKVLEDQLRNRGRAEEARRHAAEAKQRNAERVASYMAEQAKLEMFAADHCNADQAPPMRLPLCHPARWQEGGSQEAENEYKAYRALNPDGLKHENIGEGEEERLAWTIVQKDGSSLTLSIRRAFGNSETKGRHAEGLGL